MKLKRNIVLISLTILLAFTVSQCLPGVKSGKISGFVWEDENKNGLFDDGEERIASVGVQLFNDAGTVVDTTTTDASGAYHIDEIEIDEFGIYQYVIMVNPPPPGQAFTVQGSRSNQNASHVDQTGSSGKISMTVTENEHVINAGLVVATPPEPEEDTSEPPADDTAEDDQCGTANNPATWDTEYTDDNGNVYTLHYTFWGMTDLLYFYAPAVHYDGTDAAQVLNPLVQILPGGVVGITHTDCMGGCTQWTPDIWYGNGEHATMQLADNPCLLPNYRVVMIGFSTGAELALYICPYWDTCILGVSVSPNSYYGVPLTELIDSAQLAQRRWVFAHGMNDAEMVIIEDYVKTKKLVWNDVNHHQEAEQNGSLFTRTATADHGPDFWNNNPWLPETIRLAIPLEF
jgi:hypothetical protein